MVKSGGHNRLRGVGVEKLTILGVVAVLSLTIRALKNTCSIWLDRRESASSLLITITDHNIHISPSHFPSYFIMDNFDDIEDDFFDEIFYDDTYVPITLYSGTQYAGFTIADLLAYTRPVLNLKPITTKVSSTKELTDFLTTQWPSNEVQNALNRMRAVVVDTWDWGPDVLVKILPDLDVAFFNGLLKNKIQVSWQDESSIQAQEFPSQNFEYDLGATEFDKLSGICHVYLNRYNISDEVNAREAMLQTLLHELVVSIYARSKVSFSNTCLW